MTIEAHGPVLFGGAAVLCAALATLVMAPAESPSRRGQTDPASMEVQWPLAVWGKGVIDASPANRPGSPAARPIHAVTSLPTHTIPAADAGSDPDEAWESDVPDAAQWELEVAERALPSEEVDAFSPDAPLDELLRWYAHPDERFQVAALEAIAVHGEDEQAWEILSSALQDPRPVIRHLALTQIAGLSATWPDAGPLVRMSLDDPDPSMRALASVLYGELEAGGLVGKP